MTEPRNLQLALLLSNVDTEIDMLRRCLLPFEDEPEYMNEAHPEILRRNFMDMMFHACEITILCSRLQRAMDEREAAPAIAAE